MILKPNYAGGSIVNLMASIQAAFGAPSTIYPSLLQLDEERLRKKRNVVLVVIDGLGDHYLQTHGLGSFLHQHRRDRLTSVFPTTTASAITTFATGVAPQQHAITGWFMYLHEIGTVSAILPFVPRWGGEPLVKQGVAIERVADTPALYTRLDRPSTVVNHNRIVNSAYSDVSTKNARRVGYNTLEDMTAKIANTVKQGKEKQYIYAYWPEFDTLCHNHGVGSQEAKKHFLDIDKRLRKLSETLARTDTEMIITADHGLMDTEAAHMVHIDQHPRLRDTLALPLCGEPRAAYCYVRAEHDQVFRDYVSENLADKMELYSSQSLIAQGWYGLGTPHAQLSRRVGDYVLLMKENYVIKDRLLTEKPFSQIGVHGGLSEQELYVPIVTVDCA